MALRTGFVKIAESGNTIDGRVIESQWLIDAAETYDRNVYTALVFPDHLENTNNYGVLESVKLEKHGDKLELYGDFTPNVFWQSDVRYGQKQFCSIALKKDFAGTGKTYIYSVGATNTPASLGTQALQFSKKHSDMIFTDQIATNFNVAIEQPTNDLLYQFKKFIETFATKDKTLTTKDEPMTPQERLEFDKLKTDFDALTTAFNKLNETPSEETPAITTEQFAQLQTENDLLKTKVSDLENKVLEYQKLKTQLSDLEAKFATATKELPSTPVPEHRTSKTTDVDAELYSVI